MKDAGCPAANRFLRARIVLRAPLALILLMAGMFGVSLAGGIRQKAVAGLAAQEDRRPRIDFLGAWGVRGAGPENLNLAVAIAADSLGRVYIADAGSGYLHKFTADGHPLLAFEDPRVSNPVAITVDADGEIYAADGRSGRILVFSPIGDPDREQHASGLGRFRVPTALAVDADDNLFVADAGLSAVAEYNERGRLVRVLAQNNRGAQRVRTPLALALGPDGAVFVADGSNGLISKFSARGEFLASWGQPGSTIETRNPVSLAASSRYLFCFDAAPPRLLVWSLNGTPFFEMDLSSSIALSAGSGDTRASLAITPHNELLVLDPSSGKVLRFRIRF